MIAFDPEKPMVTSAFASGPRRLTTRGMKEVEMATVGGLIVEAWTTLGRGSARTRRGKVHEMARSFPLYASVYGLNAPVPSASATTARSSTRAESAEGRSPGAAGVPRLHKRFTTYERVEELMPLW
jgi:hypothetical protein